MTRSSTHLANTKFASFDIGGVPQRFDLLFCPFPQLIPEGNCRMVAQSKAARAKPETAVTLGKMEKIDRTPEVGCRKGYFQRYFSFSLISVA